MKFYSIGSGNTFGARFWTDGKMEAPMLPDKSPIVKCPKCAHLFWLAKAKQVAQIESYSSDEEAEKWEKTPEPLDPTEQDLLQLSQSGKLSRDEQVTVCLRAWWLANDKVRNSPHSRKSSFSEAELGNLKRLSSLLNEQHSGERILKAEIARETGHFKECRRVLSAKFKEQTPTERAKFIRGLAAKKDLVVRQFPSR